MDWVLRFDTRNRPGRNDAVTFLTEPKGAQGRRGAGVPRPAEITKSILRRRSCSGLGAGWQRVDAGPWGTKGSAVRIGDLAGPQPGSGSRRKSLVSW